MSASRLSGCQRLLLQLPLLLLLCTAQQTTVDPAILLEIFGTPPTLPPETDNRLEQITVRPTDATTTFTDGDGRPCKCVPYYLCDSNTNVTIEDPTLTGFGVLDIRFGKDRCQESVEVCCKEPADPATKPQPKPDSSRLKGCGYSNPKGLDFSVTGGSGDEAQFGEFPWVVALLRDDNNTMVGSGVLIHPNVILTAAHVVYKFQPGELKIRAGEWDTQTVSERLPHQERTAQEIYIHPDLNTKTLYNDIALVRLSEPVELADHINVICLPKQDQNFEDSQDCVANGWGKDVFGKPGRYAVILKKVMLNMVHRARCQGQLQRTRLGARFRLHPSFVCAGGEEGKDTCQGDGGAPLACPSSTGRYQVAGLVAWGIGCGQRDVPAVYANVAAFRGVIDSKLAQWGLQLADADF